MVKQSVKIHSLTGLTLHAAEVFCKQAVQYESKINFQYKHNTCNAKSLLSVLAAGVKNGETILLMCEGNDEEEALKGMVKAIEDGLGE